MHPRSPVRLFALVLAALALAPASPLAAQDEADADTVGPCPVAHHSLDVPARGYGLSIGNSARHTGVRINAVDRCVDRVTGVNLTLWRPRANPDFVMNGVAVGLLAPAVRDLNGIGVGGLAVVADGDVNGIAGAGLAVVAEGSIRGVAVGGLAAVAQDRLDGIAVGGLAAVGDRGINGIALGGLAAIGEGQVNGLLSGGLAAITDGGLTGIGIGGLANIVDGPMRGIGVGGLAAIVDGPATGLNVGGLGSVVDGPVRGITLGGLGVVVDGSMDGIQAGGLGVVVDGRARGLTVGGLGIVAEEVAGISLAAVRTRVEAMNGVGVAGWNDVRGPQRGLTIGIYNYARTLSGVQIGLINHVRDNPPGRRILPIINWGT